MDDPRVTPELVALLAEMANLRIDEESLVPLAMALEEHISALRRFSLSDPSEADPEIAFDPRWT